MPRHIAFLRGVSPLNLKMPDLKASLEQLGFANVRTVLSSGNVAFNCDAALAAELEQAIEAAVARQVGRHFPATVRRADALTALLRTDPFAGFGLPAQAKRVVSFLREVREPKSTLPLTEGSATVLRQIGAEVFTAYLPGPDGPVFMKLIERAYGTAVTTRTWDTVAKCAVA